jgi:hypothetical protein
VFHCFIDLMHNSMFWLFLIVAMCIMSIQNRAKKCNETTSNAGCLILWI